MCLLNNKRTFKQDYYKRPLKPIKPYFITDNRKSNKKYQIYQHQDNHKNKSNTYFNWTI